MADFDFSAVAAPSTADMPSATVVAEVKQKLKELEKETNLLNYSQNSFSLSLSAASRQVALENNFLEGLCQRLRTSLQNPSVEYDIDADMTDTDPERVLGAEKFSVEYMLRTVGWFLQDCTPLCLQKIEETQTPAIVLKFLEDPFIHDSMSGVLSTALGCVYWMAQIPSMKKMMMEKKISAQVQKIHSKILDQELRKFAQHALRAISPEVLSPAELKERVRLEFDEAMEKMVDDFKRSFAASFSELTADLQADLEENLSLSALEEQLKNVLDSERIQLDFSLREEGLLPETPDVSTFQGSQFETVEEISDAKLSPSAAEKRRESETTQEDVEKAGESEDIETSEKVQQISPVETVEKKSEGEKEEEVGDEEDDQKSVGTAPSQTSTGGSNPQTRSTPKKKKKGKKK